MSEHLLRNIGMALRARREASGYSQESYADAIEMHRTYYSAIERGEKNLQLSTLQRICTGLKCEMWEVLKDAETQRKGPECIDRSAL
jgi:transcriptional regulator with XRE-family HTH domain